MSSIAIDPKIDHKEAQRRDSRESLARRLESKAKRLDGFGQKEQKDRARSLREEAAELRTRVGRKPRTPRNRTMVFGPGDFTANPPSQDGQEVELGFGHGV